MKNISNTSDILQNKYSIHKHNEQTTSTNNHCKQNLLFKPPGVKQFHPLQPQIIQKQLGLSQHINLNDAAQLTYLMYYALEYPSLTDAENHRLASRLGCYDIDKTTPVNKNRSYCQCCGFVKQQKQIPICTSFQTFPNVGISTYLFFQTIKNLIFLLLLVTLIHSVYSLATNLKVTYMLRDTEINKSLNLYQFLSSISLSWKQNAIKLQKFQSQGNFYLVEMWIGVLIVILWSLFLYIIKYYERKYQAMVNLGTISAADFSIIIQNYPQNLSLQQLQQQFNAYANKLTDQNCLKQDCFFIQKINLSVDSTFQTQQQSQIYGIHQQYIIMLQMFAQWVSDFYIMNSLPFTLKKRTKIYQKFQKIKTSRLQQGKKLLQTIYNQNPSQDNLSISDRQPLNRKQPKGKTIAIVTFRYSNTKDLVAKYNCLDIAKKIRNILSCCPNENKFVLMDQSTNMPVQNVKISKAPEPQDIKWENLSVSHCEKLIRKTFTYFITLILLCTSFVLVYGLENLQMKYQNNFYTSIIISLTIALVNFIIGFLIRFVTIFQKDYTQTGYQSSLAIKSIWAQLLNSIVIPFFANYIIEDKNIYGKNGLSTDVIYLSLSTSFLPVINKIFDPYYQYIQIKAFFFRNALKKRLLMKQQQLNDSQQFMQFQTGYEYIYFINLYLFTAYFVTLQPCISIFAILGMIMMYWLHKYSLFNRVRRPVPGTDLVNTAMGQMVSLGPIFFALGALTWSHFLQQYKIQKSYLFYYLPNIIAGGLAALFFIFPFSIIFDRCLPKQVQQNLQYQTCRILLTSQYDRSNPATMEKAIRQYKSYIENYVAENNSSPIHNDDKFQLFNHTLNATNIFTKQPNSINSNQQQKPKTNHSIFQNINNKIITEQPSKDNHVVNHILKQKINQEFLARKKQILVKNIRRKSKLIGKISVENIVAELVAKKIQNQQEQINQYNQLDDVLNEENDDDDTSQIKVSQKKKQLGQSTHSGNNFIKILHRTGQPSDNYSNNDDKNQQQQPQINIISIKPKRYLPEKQNMMIKSHHQQKQPTYQISTINNKIKQILSIKQSSQQTDINLNKNMQDTNYINYFDTKNKYNGRQISNTKTNQQEINPYDRIFN